MIKVFTIGLFFLVVGALSLLVKWEFRRAQRRTPPLSKTAQQRLRHLDEPGHTYEAPPDRTNRAFQQKSGRS